MSGSLQTRLAALEALIEKITAADDAAHDPRAPIKWGRGLPGMMDLVISMDARISRLDPKTEQPQRQKYFALIWCGFRFFLMKLNGNRATLEGLDQDKFHEMISIVQKHAAKLETLERRIGEIAGPKWEFNEEKIEKLRDAFTVVI